MSEISFKDKLYGSVYCGLGGVFIGTTLLEAAPFQNIGTAVAYAGGIVTATSAIFAITDRVTQTLIPNPQLDQSRNLTAIIRPPTIKWDENWDLLGTRFNNVAADNDQTLESMKRSNRAIYNSYYRLYSAHSQNEYEQFTDELRYMGYRLVKDLFHEPGIGASQKARDRANAVKDGAANMCNILDSTFPIEPSCNLTPGSADEKSWKGWAGEQLIYTHAIRTANF